MFKEGDRIKVAKAHGQSVIAKILEIRFNAGTYVAKVFREDRQIEDVFAWNIYQDEISVCAMPPQAMVTMSQEEFDRKIAEATARGYKAGCEVTNDEWRNSEYKGLEL